MKLRRVVAVALLFGSAPLLGACSPFSASMSDMWPHWAGGEPAGLPPRPGQPGYQDFIAHGQAVQNPAGTPAAQQAPGGTTAAIAAQKSPAPPPGRAQPAPQENNDEPAAEAAEHPVSDTVVRGGGLY